MIAIYCKFKYYSLKFLQYIYDLHENILGALAVEKKKTVLGNQ